ncbi:anti-sigma factor family protein [Urbifossiella limnaea]|uniref:Zinc-finger domain-containing protein n=1 Tax=Urbifossiella limnaea TaxID=2528023 RepID=A0A517XX56_9BACT|nr:hypothetical protein [Urbifossiella limnaea]QDU22089.1 hypothetical protein ETAA1_40640 [Urbifossiella limnaea]
MPAPLPIADCDRVGSAIQAVLDGHRPDFDADAHVLTCAACRARVAEARVLLAALAVPPEPIAVPPGFADGVLAAVRADRPEPSSRRLLATAGAGFAVAASLLVAAWLLNSTADRQVVVEATRSAPPVRVSAELAKAGDAFRESSRPLTEPAAAAPKVLASIADAMFPPMPTPAGDTVAPAAASIAELPAAARTGLEPVAGTTQKAFSRLLRDVNVFSSSARPKS